MVRRALPVLFALALPAVLPAIAEEARAPDSASAVSPAPEDSLAVTPIVMPVPADSTAAAPGDSVSTDATSPDGFLTEPPPFEPVFDF